MSNKIKYEYCQCCGKEIIKKVNDRRLPDHTISVVEDIPSSYPRPEGFERSNDVYHICENCYNKLRKEIADKMKGIDVLPEDLKKIAKNEKEDSNLDIEEIFADFFVNHCVFLNDYEQSIPQALYAEYFKKYCIKHHYTIPDFINDFGFNKTIPTTSLFRFAYIISQYAEIDEKGIGWKHLVPVQFLQEGFNELMGFKSKKLSTKEKVKK